MIAAADRHVVGLDGVRLIDQAGARAPGLVGAVEVDVVHAFVVILLAKDVIAHADQGFPVFVQLDHVLHIKAGGLLEIGPFLVEVSRVLGHWHQCIAVNRDLGYPILAE
ncbi:hypothetical protein D3C81_1286000 [compost metagenome]